MSHENLSDLLKNINIDRFNKIKRKSTFFKFCKNWFIVSQEQAFVKGKKYEHKYLINETIMINLKFGTAGSIMEMNKEILEEVNDELKESKKILMDLCNEINVTQDLLSPSLAKLIQSIRNTRMAVITELSQTLKIMKDVRNFFLESDYEKEMKRLERFTNLGEKLKELIQDGTLDILINASIKLALKEIENEKQQSIQS